MWDWTRDAAAGMERARFERFSEREMRAGPLQARPQVPAAPRQALKDREGSMKIYLRERSL